MQKGKSNIYVISLKGQLDQKWEKWFENFQVYSSHFNTELIGEIEDQAALHGLLKKIRDTGLHLNFIKELDESKNDEF